MYDQEQDQGPDFGPHVGQQPLPVDFTQADSLRLQQLNAGLSEVSKQVADNTLLPEHADELQQQIMAQKMPLLQKQKAAADAARQTQLHQMQEDSALSQGMAQTDAVFRARTLQQRLVPVLNPMTNQTAYLYEQEPGKWGQVDFGDGQQANDFFPLADPTNAKPSPSGPMAGLGVGGMGPNDAAATKGGAPPWLSQTGGVEQGVDPGTGFGVQGEGSPASDEARGYTGESPGGPPPRVADVGADGHTLEIWNGAKRELVHYDRGGQIIGRQAYDEEGNPVRPTTQQEEDVLTAHEMDHIRTIAEQSVPPVPHPTSNSPAAIMHYQQAQNARALQVARFAQGIANRAIQQKHAQQHQAWRSQENAANDQRIKDRQQRHEDLLAARKEQKANFDKQAAEYRKHLGDMAKQVGAEENWKGKDFKERLQEAKDRLKMMGHEEPVNPEAAAPGEAKQEPQQPTPPPEVMNGPSSIGPERVQELLKEIDSTKVEGGYLGGWIPSPQVQKKRSQLLELKQILQKAAAEQRPLTIAERAMYEQKLAKLGGDDKGEHVVQTRNRLAPVKGK